MKILNLIFHPYNYILIYSKNVSNQGKERLEVLRNFDNGFDIQQTFALENVHKFYTKAKTLKEAGFLKL